MKWWIPFFMFFLSSPGQFLKFIIVICVVGIVAVIALPTILSRGTYEIPLLLLFVGYILYSKFG